jgi:hypothetical protein
MGDVVHITAARRTRRPDRRDGESLGPATVVLFTGIRIERWGERDFGRGPDEAPTNRPTSPKRRRRRST